MLSDFREVRRLHELRRATYEAVITVDELRDSEFLDEENKNIANDCAIALEKLASKLTSLEKATKR